MFGATDAPLPGAEIVALDDRMKFLGGRDYITPVPTGADRAPLAFRRACERADPHERTTTGSGGRFVLHGLEGGGFALVVAAASHEPLETGRFAAGSDVVLRLQHEQVLDVALVDVADGRRLAVAEARAWRVLDPGGDEVVELVVESRPDGGVRVHGTGPLGTWLDLRATGYARVLVLAPGDAGTSSPFEVGTAPGPRLAVRVVSTSGDPLPGARPTLRREIEDRAAPSASLGRAEFAMHDDANGRATFATLGPGRYSLSVDLPLHARGLVDDISLDGHEEFALDVVLERAASLRGVIAASDGGGPSFERVSLYDAADPDSPAPVELDLAAGGTRELDFALPEGLVRGRVIDAADGTPREGVFLELTRRLSRTSPVCVSGPGGEFVFEFLVPGTYTLVCVDSPEEHLPWRGEALELQEGGAIDVLVALESGASIAGRVFDFAGLPATRDIQVQAVRGGRVCAQDRVEADGSYELEGLSSGEYFVRAASWTFDWVPDDDDFGLFEPTPSAWERVTLSDDEALTLDLTLSDASH